MFTGIVTDVGRVRHIERRGDTHVVISTGYDPSTIEIGASIACSGACLTVVDKGTPKDRWFAVTLSGETLSKTTLAGWKVGDSVNLERSTRVTFEAPANLARFIAPKGSVALDGVSLTVNEVDGVRFGVNIIPHTLKV